MQETPPIRRMEAHRDDPLDKTWETDERDNENVLECWGVQVDDVVLILALAADLGWILLVPLISIPTIIMAILTQSWVVYTCRRLSGPLLAFQCSAWVWLFTTFLWLGAEFVWDATRPVGMLGSVGLLVNLSPTLYEVVVVVSTVLVSSNFFLVTLYYLWKHLHVKPEDAQLQVELRNYAWFCPWLLMDAAWMLCDWHLIHASDIGVSFYFLFSLGLAAGVVTLFLCGHYLWRHVGAPPGLCAAEICWVAGNAVWLVRDAVASESDVLHGVCALFFMVGIPFGVFGSLARDHRSARAALISSSKPKYDNSL
uniref:Uncharacterized protein n=1 Tax=Noctiluca scintillans TaxID=2966 RepID=A0A7S0ZMQ8_NOCSC